MHSNYILKKIKAGNQQVRRYENNMMTIFRPSVTLNSSVVLNDFYHLIIPGAKYLTLKVDSRVYRPEEKKIFVVNPDQLMEGFREEKVVEYLAIFIRKRELEKISKVVIKKSKISFVNQNFIIDQYFMELLNRFIYESTNQQTGYQMIMDCISSQIVVSLIRYVSYTADSFPEIGIRRKNIKCVIAYIREYYNQNFTLGDLAKLANLSPYHFIRVFKTETGKTPFDYLIDVKVEMAKELLSNYHQKITEISMECGFSSPSHFSAVFKRKTGMTPSNYRKQKNK